MALQPGTTLGPYQVTAKISEGGMGKVYRAAFRACQMRGKWLGTAAIVLSAGACSSPSAPTESVSSPTEGSCCIPLFSWTDDGRSSQASTSFTFDTCTEYFLTGLDCGSGRGVEIAVETVNIALRQDYTVADQDLAVSYTDGSTEEGGEWGAGPFGGSGSLTVSEAFVGGEFYLTGTFTFELVPTSGDLVGVTKSLEGTFENLWITYDQKSC